MKLRDKLFAGAFSLTIIAGLPALGWLYRDNQENRISPDDAGFPVFNCQEDELMVWQDARHTSECVNVEEYEHDLHVEAGHIDG